MKENPLQYRVRGTPVPTTQTRGTNYPKSTAINSFGFKHDWQSKGMTKIQSMPVMTTKLTSRRTDTTPTANQGN